MISTMQSNNLHFRVRDIYSHIPKFLPLLFHPRRNSASSGAEHERGSTILCDALAPDRLQVLPPGLGLSSMNNVGAPPKSLVCAVRNLEPFLPDGCELFGQEDLKMIGSGPVDAGSFADIWIGERNGTRVIIKSYRLYASSSPLPIFSRLYKEALICSQLEDGGQSFVSSIGVYSTVDHPFSVVFRFVEHSNLRAYLKNNRDVERVKLLLEIARGLIIIHSHGLVHGNLSITNILVGCDGRARIAGLGTASSPSTVPMRDKDRLFHRRAPGLTFHRRREFNDFGPTTASDIFAFALIAWEVFEGSPPFFDMNVAAGVYSMLNGCRPDRPNHPELSNRIWKMIQKCWKSNPAKRMELSRVIAILEKH